MRSGKVVLVHQSGASLEVDTSDLVALEAKGLIEVVVDVQTGHERIRPTDLARRMKDEGRL